MQAAHKQLYPQPWISMLLISPLEFPGCGKHCYDCCYSCICRWCRLSLSLWGCNSKWCNSKHSVAPSQKTTKLFMMNPWPWMQLTPHILTDLTSEQAVTFFHYCAGSTQEQTWLLVLCNLQSSGEPFLSWGWQHCPCGHQDCCNINSFTQWTSYIHIYGYACYYFLLLLIGGREGRSAVFLSPSFIPAYP